MNKPKQQNPPGRPKRKKTHTLSLGKYERIVYTKQQLNNVIRSRKKGKILFVHIGGR